MSLQSTRTRIPFIVYHALAIGLCILVCLISPPSFETNFMDIIPSFHVDETMVQAEGVFTANQDKSVTFYVGSGSFEQARATTDELIESLKSAGLFDEISLGSDSYDITSMQGFISENAHLLLSRETADRIISDPSAFVDESLATIFGAFTVSSLSALDQDPFLLSEPVMMDYIGKASSLTSFSPSNGYMVSENDDGVWIMFTGILCDKAASVANSKGIKTFFKVCDQVQEKHLESQIVYSGIALHSCESAANSQREITFITVFSIAAILVLFMILCRNLSILKLFLLSLVLSLTSAVAVLLIFFRSLHVMTLIFGTTLIGTCIDYSIHYYVRYANRAEGEDGYAVRSKLLKSLSIGFGSTILCYLLLLFSPYPILRQIAVFSAAGLLSSYLTTLFLYPAMIRPKMVNVKAYLAKPDHGFRMPNSLIYIIAAASTVLLAFSIPRLEIKNNIADLYTPSDRLLQCEIKASEVLGYESATYAIVAEPTAEQALETTSRLCSELDTMIEEGKLEGYVSSSLFVPSKAQQERSLEAARSLLPYLDEMCDILGIEEAAKEGYKAKLEEGRTISIDDLPQSIRQMIANVSIGEVNGSFCEVIILRNVSDNESIASLMGSCTNAHYFQTAVDVSTQLDELTRIIMVLFSIAFVMILVLLMIMFGLRKGFRMALAPYSMLVVTICASWIFGLKIDFFYAVGMVLVVGLGLDYIVFACEGGRGSSRKAILMSFITTELSFGTLLFSSFKPVHIFGLSVFSGILAAFLFAMASVRDGK